MRTYRFLYIAITGMVVGAAILLGLSIVSEMLSDPEISLALGEGGAVLVAIYVIFTYMMAGLGICLCAEMAGRWIHRILTSRSIYS